jgi:hypothetical protein
MNGYDFNHRILKPWVRDPAYYGLPIDCRRRGTSDRRAQCNSAADGAGAAKSRR